MAGVRSRQRGRIAPQRCQGLPSGQVHPFDQGRADREAQVRQAFGAKNDAGAERLQFAVLLLFDGYTRKTGQFIASVT